MKHGIKPTYEQRKIIQRLSNLDTHNVLVIKDTPTELWVQNKEDDSIIILQKKG